MSSFNNNGVTLKGAVIIASLVAGQTLTFTRMAVGDGVLPSGQTPFSTEKMINPLFDVPILNVESDSVAHATVKGVFSNADLDTGFYYRELGLYAINPVTKAEELFCYGNAGDDAEWINAVGESSLIEKEIHLVTLIGSATTVTANFDEKATVLKSEYDAAMKLKADLDAEGGRVVASQMRFDKTQTLYVDASAAAGGDGTESRPFRTIQEAVDARYRGATNAIINIAPGDYDEVISISNIAGLAWTFQRNGTGVAKVKSLAFGACTHVAVTNLTIEPEESFGLSLNNVASAYLTGITINANQVSNGFSVGFSRAVIFQTVINNANIAVATGNNAHVTMVSVAGTGNSIVVSADASIVTMAANTITGLTKYDKLNGGVINVEGGGSSYPSNYSQLYNLGAFSTSESIKNAILTEFGKLRLSESRICCFDTTVPFGPFVGNQRIRCDITKLDTAATGHGVVMFYSFRPTATTAIMQILSGVLSTAEPVALVDETMVANTASYGLMRVAAIEEEVDPTVEDAAITPANLFRMANYRISETAYVVGDIVGVPYHAEFVLECTKAGKTSGDVLDTTNVTSGDTITDGTVTWTVKPNAIVNATISGKVITLTFSDGSTKKLTTQDTAPYTSSATAIGGASTTKPAVVVESYRSGYTWYRKYSDGWIEQAGRVAYASPATVNLPIAFKTTDYTIMQNVSDGTATAGSNRFNVYNGEKTTTSFKFKTEGKDGNAPYMYWTATGY